MVEPPIPTVTAMLLCDQIIVDRETGKKSLIGIFEAMGTFVFPVAVPRISIYVRIVDGFGKYPIKLRLVKLSDESLIQDIDAEINVQDAMHAWELVVNMMGVSLPAPGKYEFQFYTRDIYLHRVTMEVTKIEGGSPWPQQLPPQ
jgi:hypothetical protein